MIEVKTSLSEFINSKLKVSWISPEGLHVYVRKSQRVLPITAKVVYCLDIANVSADVRNRGTFTRWLSESIETATKAEFDAIYVESVLTERFANYFRRLNWIESSHEIPCFFLVLEKS